MDPSDLENLSPEQLKQLMELGIIPDELSALDRQYKSADALRGTAMPEGRDSGRVYTAANPMEAVGSLMKQYAGNRDVKKIEGKQDALLQKQLEGRNLFMNKQLGIQPGITEGVQGGHFGVEPKPDMAALTAGLRAPTINQGGTPTAPLPPKAPAAPHIAGSKSQLDPALMLQAIQLLRGNGNRSGSW